MIATILRSIWKMDVYMSFAKNSPCYDINYLKHSLLHENNSSMNEYEGKVQMMHVNSSFGTFDASITHWQVALSPIFQLSCNSCMGFDVWKNKHLECK